MSATNTAAAEHPSPHRARVKTSVLLAGLAAGPAAWIAQLVVSYAVSSQACSYARQSGSGSGQAFAGETPTLIGINLACLLFAALGGTLSYRNWRRTRLEKPGRLQSALAIGEGRTRFIATCGMISAVIFAIAILFNTLEPLLVSACWTGKP
jgi:cytochrome c biogenesis factor